MTLTEAEGGYYIELVGRPRATERWVTKDKDDVVRLVRQKFLGELTPKQREYLDKAMKEGNEAEKKYEAEKKRGSK